MSPVMRHVDLVGGCVGIIDDHLAVTDRAALRSELMKLHRLIWAYLTPSAIDFDFT